MRAVQEVTCSMQIMHFESCMHTLQEVTCSMQIMHFERRMHTLQEVTCSMQIMHFERRMYTLQEVTCSMQIMSAHAMSCVHTLQEVTCSKPDRRETWDRTKTSALQPLLDQLWVEWPHSAAQRAMTLHFLVLLMVLVSKVITDA